MAGSMSSAEKVAWSGRVVAVQPRIRLTRSFDERSHSYLGYVLHIEGTGGAEAGAFLIAVGEAAHEKHRFQAGMELSGHSVPVEDQRKETAALYKTSGLRVVRNAEGETPAGPPYLGVPLDLETYRARGHRRLDARTYDAKCTTCVWGCRMAVEMIIDQWNPSKKQYRFETFCYGPEKLPFLPARTRTQGSGAQRHVLHRGGLGRQRRHCPSRAG